MQRSVRSKIALTFIVLMVVVLAAIGLFQRVFLNRFYIHEKEKQLIRSWELIRNNEDVGSVPDSFVRFCSASGLTYCVTDSTMSYWNTNAPDGDRMASKLFGILLGKEEEYTEVLLQRDGYTLMRDADRFSGIPMLELWGVMDGGSYFLVSTPLQSITDAVRISNRFNLYIGLAGIVLGALVMWLVSGRLERQIAALQSEKEALQKDIEEKERMDAMRRDFLSDVSHELKTPISLIRGYAEGLKDGVRTDPESRAFYCDVIMDEAEKMHHLVQDITALNQLESGRVELDIESFDLHEVIRGVLSSLDVMIREAGAQVTFAASGPLLVKGDRFRIGEVVTNYLTNAIHHLEGGNQIEITCLVEGDTVTTTVFNEGAPIPDAERENIWIKFYKVDKARTRAYGGSGIGLSIVKAIMDAHGQTCGFENFENGVAFRFTLPLAGPLT